MYIYIGKYVLIFVVNKYFNALIITKILQTQTGNSKTVFKPKIICQTLEETLPVDAAATSRPPIKQQQQLAQQQRQQTKI